MKTFSCVLKVKNSNTTDGNGNNNVERNILSYIFDECSKWWKKNSISKCRQDTVCTKKLNIWNFELYKLSVHKSSISSKTNDSWLAIQVFLVSFFFALSISVFEQTVTAVFATFLSFSLRFFVMQFYVFHAFRRSFKNFISTSGFFIFFSCFKRKKTFI